jgi:hypothetical protein
MTRQKTLKKKVRARMEKTGESYAAARAQLVKEGASPGDLLPGYPTPGGQQRETAALRNVLSQAGIQNPLTQKPFTEAMVQGLCGGVSFMYFVFEYKGHDPMLTVGFRWPSYPEPFIKQGLERMGVAYAARSTTSAAKAEKDLNAVLEKGRAALVHVGEGGLPHRGLSAEMNEMDTMMAMSPQMVAVCGQADDLYLLDDTDKKAHAISGAQMKKARAGFKQAKNLMISVDKMAPGHDLKKAIADAIEGTIRDFTVPPKKGFKNNFGLVGIEKWTDLAADTKDKKSWSRVFADEALLKNALLRVEECIERADTPPSAGRSLYAAFLKEASGLVKNADLKKAAKTFEKSAREWSALASWAAKAGKKKTLDSEAVRGELSQRLNSLYKVESEGVEQLKDALN